MVTMIKATRQLKQHMEDKAPWCVSCDSEEMRRKAMLQAESDRDSCYQRASLGKRTGESSQCSVLPRVGAFRPGVGIGVCQ